MTTGAAQSAYSTDSDIPLENQLVSSTFFLIAYSKVPAIQKQGVASRSTLILTYCQIPPHISLRGSAALY